jgi:hypothetical protein
MLGMLVNLLHPLNIFANPLVTTVFSAGIVDKLMQPENIPPILVTLDVLNSGIV